MLKFIPRAEFETQTRKVLWQACDIGYEAPVFPPSGGLPFNDGNCYYCRYRNTWTVEDEFFACTKKHACNYSAYPFIRMDVPMPIDVEQEHRNPDGTYITYAAAGIFRQVKFESVPLYVQLYVATHGEAQCNAHCWYHAWRLENKKTWRQCGQTHLCQSNGSMWALMVPNDEELRNEFYRLF